MAAPQEERMSANLGPWELLETKPPTEDHTWAGPRPPVDMQQGAALSSAVGGDAPNPEET